MGIDKNAVAIAFDRAMGFSNNTRITLEITESIIEAYEAAKPPSPSVEGLIAELENIKVRPFPIYKNGGYLEGFVDMQESAIKIIRQHFKESPFIDIEKAAVALRNYMVETGDTNPIDLAETCAEAWGLNWKNRTITRQHFNAPEGKGGAWQPIATAPKDGCIILGCHFVKSTKPNTYSDSYTIWHIQYIEDANAFVEILGGEVLGDGFLTHWMPLPAPPGQEQQPPASTQGKDDLNTAGDMVFKALNKSSFVNQGTPLLNAMMAHSPASEPDRLEGDRSNIQCEKCTRFFSVSQYYDHVEHCAPKASESNSITTGPSQDDRTKEPESTGERHGRMALGSLPPSESDTVGESRAISYFKNILIGGNHLASSLIGTYPPDGIADYNHALRKCGQPYADMWVAWRAIMDARHYLLSRAVPEGKE